MVRKGTKDGEMVACSRYPRYLLATDEPTSLKGSLELFAGKSLSSRGT